MTDAQFFKSFQFNLFQSKRSYSKSIDNSPYNYFGRVISGKARILSGQITLQLREGDIFFIPKGLNYRSYWSCEGGSIAFYSFGFSLIPLNMQSDFQLQKLECTPEENALFGLLEQNTTVDPQSVGNLYRFLGAVVPKMAASPRSKSDLLLDTALEFMRANHSYTVADVARHCKVSQCNLFIKFRKHLGKTPVEVRHQLLSEKATTLLATTDLSIEEISSFLGFSSSSYFRKILKATTGKTPTQIRKSQRQLL